jgi:hypothetical protein
MNNEELFEKAKDAITALFNDTSVSKVTTEDNLHELIGEIQIMLDALESDR